MKNAKGKSIVPIAINQGADQIGIWHLAFGISPALLALLPALPEVCERQLDVCLSIVLIVVERERDVQCGSVFGEEVAVLGGAPGDCAEDAAALLERHLEMAFLQLPRAIHDLDV